MSTILHICDWYHPIGGAERLLFDTLDLLERQGHVNIIAYNDHEDQRPTGRRPEYPLKWLELYIYYHPTAEKMALAAIKPLKEIIRRHRPDFCHIHNFQNPYVTKWLIDTLPVVRSVHDPRLYCFTQWRLLPDKSICPHPLGPKCLELGCVRVGRDQSSHTDANAPFVWLLNRVHRRMPLLIAESAAQSQCLYENGFPPEQVAHLPNFTPVEPEEEVRRFVDAQFDPKENIVLFVGRASYEKGAHVLLQACRHLSSKARVVCITAGPELAAIQEQARAIGDRVEIIPGLPYAETRAWYARASVVVTPSVWLENFCLVGLEAGVCMKPVIGSCVGGITDWLVDGETGWFAAPGDPVDLAAKIDEALSDPERLQRMGRAAYRRVAALYTPDIYLKGLTDAYAVGVERFHGRKTP